MNVKNRYIQVISALIFVSLYIILVQSSVSAAGSSYLFAPEGANFYVYGRGTDTFIINQSRIAQLQIDKNIAQLSSGLRINNASDDPSGLAVAEKMNSLIQQMKQESVNDEDMKNLYNYTESVIGQDSEAVKRIRELAVSAANGILTDDDREMTQTEIDELIKQVDMNAAFSQFNKVLLVPSLTSANLGLNAINVVHDPEGATEIADTVLSKLTKQRVLQGVKSNILTFRIEGKSYNFINLQQSESSIRDLDMAEGVTELMKNCVLLKSRYGIIARPK